MHNLSYPRAVNAAISNEHITVYHGSLDEVVQAALSFWKGALIAKVYKADKTEFLLIGNERQRSKYLSEIPVEVF